MIESFIGVDLLRSMTFKHIATDLSAAFIASVMENCPDAIHVFDRFHVVKLMNEKLDGIRRAQYAMEKNINRRRVLKGTGYLLLMNGEDIYDSKYKTTHQNGQYFDGLPIRYTGMV